MDFFSITNLSRNMMPETDLAATISEKSENIDFSMMLSNLSDNVSNLNHPMQNTGAEITSGKTESLKVDQSGIEKRNIKDATVTDNSADAKMDDETVKDVVEFKDDVVSAISEETGVDVEDIEKAMEVLGLSIADLLNPQNLANLVQNLTQAEDVTALLLSDDFSQLLSEITDLASQLSESLSMDGDEMTQMLSQFDFNVSENDLPEMNFENLLGQEPAGDKVEQATANTVTNQEGQALSPLQEAEGMKEAATVEVAVTDEVPVDAKKDADLSETTVSENDQEPEANLQATVTKEKADTTEEDGFMKESSNQEESNPMLHQHNPEVQVQNSESVSFSESTASYVSSYTSVDATQILEQITSNLKLTLAADTTTMEMQLNPENLGKVFLQVSSKEGIVSAQITASNETVKEVLETQMATLRENLNQQGVKVDAIEVTVSSHGFEKNLDSGQQREQQEGEMQEANKKTRRSIRLDSLDELSGLMTEEEMLVAQIMKDNGNSMDLTA